MSQPRITSQYQLSEKFIASIDAVTEKLDDVIAALSTLTFRFNIGGADGVQLDIIGAIVGASRTVTYLNGSIHTLTDTQYRKLIKAKIIQNHWDGKLTSLYAAWQELFPGGSILVDDSQLMSANIVISGTFSDAIINLINNGFIVPRPQGVEYTYGFGTRPYFGFDADDEFVSGFDTGNFI
jgi:uncharacterized protein DUF2612